MNKLALFGAFLGISVLMAACGSAVLPTPTAKPPLPTATASPANTPSSTPDLCTPAALPESVKIVNTYVTAFEKYASLAQQNIPPSALLQLIATMKDIRTAAQNQPVPPCLIALKHDALIWMDTTIQTMTAVQSNPSCVPTAPVAQQAVCASTLAAGGFQARKFNDDYAAELARLVGVTLAAPSGTPGTQAPPAATSTPPVVMVLNPGPNPLNLRAFPSLTSQTVGSLAANISTTALGKTTTGEWLLVEIPGKPGKSAWVYASLVEFMNGNLGALPVVAH